MSFCIHCGSKLPDGSRFCINCGAPVDEPEAINVQQPVQPFQEAVQGQTTQLPQYDEEVTEPVQQQPAQAPVQQYVQQYPSSAAAPVAVKKKTNFKLWIILGAIATVLIIGIIVFFTVIFPEITARHINMGNYVKVKFTSSKFVNGYIKGYMNLDLESAYDDIVKADNTVSGYEFKRYFNWVNIDFKNKKSDDIIVEKVDFASNINNIGELERKLGVRFDKDVTTQVKLSDELEKQDINVYEPVEADLFKYIDKCYYNKGIHQKDVTVNLENKTFKDGQYNLEVSGFTGGYGYRSCSIYIKEDATTLGYVTVEADKDKGNNGSKVTFTLSFTSSDDDKSLVSGTPFIVKKTSKSYTINTQQGLTKSQAEKYLGVVKKKVNYIFSSSSYKMTTDYYLFTNKNKNADTVNMLISLISKKSKTGNSKYYVAYIIKNSYIDSKKEKKEDQFQYETTDIKYNYKSMSSLWNNIKKAWGSKYKIQKVD